MPIAIPDHANWSTRYKFQWYYVKLVLDAGGTVLNVGCSDDPLKFGDAVTHFDYDDWSAVHTHFVQGDAHQLSQIVGSKSFDLVVLGDVLEHAVVPELMAVQCCWVARQYVILTVFKEWRLPGHGQWLDEGREIGRQANIALGFTDVEEYHAKHFPLRKSGGDDPHLEHINQFDVKDIDLVISAMEYSGFELEIFMEADEPVLHEGHALTNWLIAMRRKEVTDAGKVRQELEPVSCAPEERILEEVISAHN